MEIKRIFFMKAAPQCALKALARVEVPAGAVVVDHIVYRIGNDSIGKKERYEKNNYFIAHSGTGANNVAVCPAKPAKL